MKDKYAGPDEDVVVDRRSYHVGDKRRQCFVGRVGLVPVSIAQYSTVSLTSIPVHLMSFR